MSLEVNQLLIPITTKTPPNTPNQDTPLTLYGTISSRPMSSAHESSADCCKGVLQKTSNRKEPIKPYEFETPKTLASPEP